MENERSTEQNLEAVFIAANVREIESAEKLLQDEGIEYFVRPEVFARGAVFTAGPYNGLLFEVLAGQAEYCRRLLVKAGLKHGVVTEPP